jgi:hypothetical protein
MCDTGWNLGWGDSTASLDLLELRVDQSMTCEISGVLAPSDWGFGVNPSVCLGFFISQGTSGTFPIRSLIVQIYIRGPGAVWGFKFVSDL